MIRLIYPESKTVSEETILTMADDAVLAGYTDVYPETVNDAVEILESLGIITIDRRVYGKR